MVPFLVVELTLTKGTELLTCTAVLVQLLIEIFQPSPMGSARTSLLTCNTNVGQLSPIGPPQPDLLAPRTPTISPSPLPTTYGSPYGTPTARPSYGNFRV